MDRFFSLFEHRLSIAAMTAAAILWIAAGLLQAAPSAAKTVSYSTGAAGRQLKWLSAASPDADRAVQAAAAEPAGPGNDAKSVRRALGDSFVDPLGGPKANLLNPPAAKPGSSSSQQSTLLPPSGQAVPRTLLDAPQTSESAPKAAASGQGPGIEEQLKVAIAPAGEECPDPETFLVPLSKKQILESVKPKSGEFPKWCQMGKASFIPRTWEPSTFHWTASALCHKPVYFEDLQLERYGHTWGPWLQPFVSGGHFFLSVPALPYAIGLFPPNECIYTLGYYRPGSCAPYMLDALPLSIRAAALEAGAWTGAVFAIP